MSGIGDRYSSLLEELFADYGVPMVPATTEAVGTFRERAAERGVPAPAVDELAGFYEVTNGVPTLDGCSVHSCDDDALFEWWGERELWLGGRDDDVMRWVRNRFCLGDASNVTYGARYELKRSTTCSPSSLANRARRAVSAGDGR